MKVDVNQRITIEQALNHIFLKDVDVSWAKNEFDFITLRYELKDNEINKKIIFYLKFYSFNFSHKIK